MYVHVMYHRNPQFVYGDLPRQPYRIDHEKEMYLGQANTHASNNSYYSIGVNGMPSYPHSSNARPTVSAANSSYFQPTSGHPCNMQQFLPQHKLAAAAVAQQQLALAAVRGSNPHQDEISKSLQMYATSTAYRTGPNSTPSLQVPVDDVMHDFACNGHISDDFNRYHQVALQLVNSGINTTAADVRNNFWNMLPTHVQQYPNAAAANNMEYHNNKKNQQKRGYKNEKLSSTRHCVFCENNNEPEAVVKSHAVRDSFNRVLCPKLRTYVCPICNASGDMAHTIKYCPQKPIITMEDAVNAEALRLAKGNYYKQRMKI